MKLALKASSENCPEDLLTLTDGGVNEARFSSVGNPGGNHLHKHQITLLILEAPGHLATFAIASQPHSGPTIRTFDAFERRLTRSALVIISPRKSWL